MCGGCEVFAWERKVLLEEDCFWEAADIWCRWGREMQDELRGRSRGEGGLLNAWPDRGNERERRPRRLRSAGAPAQRIMYLDVMGEVPDVGSPGGKTRPAGMWRPYERQSLASLPIE